MFCWIRITGWQYFSPKKLKMFHYLPLIITVDMTETSAIPLDVDFEPQVQGYAIFHSALFVWALLPRGPGIMGRK